MAAVCKRNAFRSAPPAPADLPERRTSSWVSRFWAAADRCWKPEPGGRRRGVLTAGSGINDIPHVLCHDLYREETTDCFRTPFGESVSPVGINRQVVQERGQ